MRFRVLALTIGATGLLIAGAIWRGGAMAAETGGCESFAWPMKTELQWMAGEAHAVASGAKLETLPEQALEVKLAPMKDIAFPVAPTGKRKGEADKEFGGIVEFEKLPSAGVYQISLSGRGWIDPVQGGKALPSKAHSGKTDCQGLRKSVRFELGAAPLIIELSGVPQATIKVTIRKAE